MGNNRFSLSPAKRGALPLFIGLCGPSGGGKTYSALRLATGIQRVASGKLAVIDTEANRSLHYADTFAFDHMALDPPHDPESYLEAIRACVEAGAKTIVVDSMSHEHEGQGGVLEWHASEVDRLSRGDESKRNAVQFMAWAEPKAARRRLLNGILQLHCNLVLCFRARKKLQLPTAEQKRSGQREPIALGWMPVGGEEFAFEMTALGVLPPGARGVPDWSPQEPGSDMITKRPAQFEGILRPGEVLSEDMGEAMARWAAGNAAEARKSKLSEAARDMLQALKAAADAKAVLALQKQVTEARFNEAELLTLRTAVSRRLEQVPDTEHP